MPPEILDQILQAGTMACSAGNTQPWEFLLVTDAGLKLDLQAPTPEFPSMTAALDSYLSQQK